MAGAPEKMAQAETPMVWGKVTMARAENSNPVGTEAGPTRLNERRERAGKSRARIMEFEIWKVGLIYLKNVRNNNRCAQGNLRVREGPR